MTIPFTPSKFNPAEHEDAEYDILPPGVYRMCFTGAEWKDAKSGNGRYMNLTAQALDDSHNGTLVWHILNLENTSKAAVDIAKRDLTKILRALHLDKFEVWEDLFELPFLAQVVIDEYDGGQNNKIKRFRPIISGTAAAQMPAKPAAASPAATGGSLPNDDDLPF